MCLYSYSLREKLASQPALPVDGVGDTHANVIFCQDILAYIKHLSIMLMYVKLFCPIIIIISSYSWLYYVFAFHILKINVFVVIFRVQNKVARFQMN